MGFGLHEATSGADVLVLLTEWAEFRNVEPARLAMRRPLIVDARNVLDTETLGEHGFTVASIGRPFNNPG